jgi:hypothetical protein
VGTHHENRNEEIVIDFYAHNVDSDEAADENEDQGEDDQVYNPGARKNTVKMVRNSNSMRDRQMMNKICPQMEEVVSEKNE